MILESLYKNVTVLDRTQHRALKMRHPFTDFSPTAQMNAIFVAAVEFPDVCREYPIVFVRAGKEQGSDKDNYAPMAVLGIGAQENLFLKADGGWRANYVPAFLRRYPFGMTAIAADRAAICIDRAWAGFSETEGDALFKPDGSPTDLLQNAQTFVENYETEVQRTRQLCSMLRDDGLLQDMRFDATLPDGEKVAVDGFLAIDEKKLAELPAEKVMQYHKDGILGLIHAQQISMGLMRRLVEWHLEKVAAKKA